MTATPKIERIALGNERTYLYGVALRVAQNHKRKLKRRPEAAHIGAFDFQDTALPPDQAAELTEARDLLDRLLLTLPEELRRVLVSELTDCVTTTLNQCLPSPHGCARYVQSPACSGTLVVGNDPRGTGAAPGTSLSECGVWVQ